MASGAEFDTIRMLMDRWRDLAVDIGDDAAVLATEPGRVLVASTDACVIHVHFQPEWISPAEVGARAAAAALSDLAAMGARADALLIAFVVPDAWRTLLGDVADGIGGVVRATGARIVGGNLSRGDAFSMTTTVLGSATRVVSRAGAAPGDVLVVTGTLGGPGQALQRWMAGHTPSVWARDRFAAPVPRLAEGARLARGGASAMLDISDGLMADAGHMAAASGMVLEIDCDALPVGPGVQPQDALGSGEEYELLAAIPRALVEPLMREWVGNGRAPLTVVGKVLSTHQPGLDSVVCIGERAGNCLSHNAPDGSVMPPRVEKTGGHDHFTV